MIDLSAMVATITTLTLTDDICPFGTFKKVRAQREQAFFFETAETIGEPAAVSVIGTGGFEFLEGPVFAALRAKEVAKSESEIPYAQGGFFGCVGYDSVAELEPKLASRGYFAGQSTRLRHERNQVFFCRDLIVFEHKRKLIHFIGRAGECVAFLQPPADDNVTSAEIKPERLVPSLGRRKYFEGVNRLKNHIRAGDIFQAVLAERFECATEAAAIDIFSALRLISPTPYSFFFSFGATDFFGASPEALLKVNGRHLRTHPIAGTRRRGATAAEDILLKRQLERSSKEAAEHLMLVDLARNDLGRVAREGTVNVNFYRAVRKFSNVMHLVSEVEAELGPRQSVIDALGACFPAGTLSGAPKFRAMELLAGLEETPRGFYGGAVIGFDPCAQKLDSCIAIRSLEMNNGIAVLRAGAGIVADSKPAFEYEEIQHKLKPLRQAIASAEGRK